MFKPFFRAINAPVFGAGFWAAAVACAFICACADFDFLTGSEKPRKTNTDGLSLTPDALSQGTVGVPYSTVLTASGGVAPLIISVSELPMDLMDMGCTVSGGAAGVLIAGTPEMAGDYPVTVTITDASTPPKELIREFTFSIADPSGTLDITPTTLTAGTVDTAYSAEFIASGGVEPYTYLFEQLPSGLYANGGALLGTPASAGTFEIELVAVDASIPPRVGSASCTLQISGVGGALAVLPATLPNGMVGIFYSQTLVASGGTAPIAWSSSGTLPDGVTLDASTGVLSGTPVTAAAYTYTIESSDGSTPPLTGSREYSVTIAGASSTPAPEIGAGDHSASSVTFTVIADSTQVQTPRDLAFNPYVTNELYVVNYGVSPFSNTGPYEDGLVVIDDVTASPTSAALYRWSPNTHFMDKPSAIAFGRISTSIGDVGSFATIHESVEDSNRQFMGPTLWPADRLEFAKSEIVWTESCPHLDMLHSSSLAVGIAWESDNIYWVFGSPSLNTGRGHGLCRYDFHNDHGPGNSNHSDGAKDHYVIGELSRKAGVPGHLVFHEATNRLFICDTGNGRIVTFDTTQTGTLVSGSDIWPGDGNDTEYGGTVLVEFVPPGSLDDPCGVEILNDVVFVSDNATGIIHAYDMSGVEINWLDTGLGAGAVMGMNFGPDGKLYFCDAVDSRIYRIDP